MTARTYDDIAEWYAGWIGEAEDDPFFLSLYGLVGDVAGLDICDLACGEGRVARFLAARGANVLGVDSSRRLLDIAEAREGEQASGVTYRLEDAETLASVADATFDGVVCNMALMDIERYEATVTTVARVLRPGGWFGFSVLHPAFNTPRSSETRTPDGVPIRTVRGYWDEGYWRSDERVGPPGKIGAYHRTLATYVNALTAAGFTIEAMAEPRAQGAQAARRPVWSEVPAVLSVYSRKRELRDSVSQ
jgi:2-polyprenyl-3-methyl-5-hydroxy-6-metoxy-1,4-benzoquinol methylase